MDKPQPTSEDEMPPPAFLRTTKAKSAAKRAPTVSAAKTTVAAAPPQNRAQSASRSRSHGKKKEVEIHSGPIRPLSPKAAKDSGPIKPLSSAMVKQDKRPMAMLPGAKRPQEDHRSRKQAFLQHMAQELSSSWPSDSMAWVNLHVAGYYHDLGGCTHPRQLAACSLRSDSTQEHRWSCWACNLDPVEARAAGFSPSKSLWHSDVDQFYHWWTVHGKDSHWDWVREAESMSITTKEMLQFLLACDLEQWPFPWTRFALRALPREVPSRRGGHNERLWGHPFLRKPTPATANSELHNQPPATTARSNRPVSPPPPAQPQNSITELGWTNPVDAYGTSAQEELRFLISPFKTVKEYGASRVAWHEDQCGMQRLSDFLLTIEQHCFFLLYIKLVATLALGMPENLTGQLREAALGQVSVCAPQLKEAFLQGAKNINPPSNFRTYIDTIYNYMNEVIEITLPIMGSTIPRPPAPPGVFPPYVPSSATPAPPTAPTTSSTASSSRKRSSTAALEYEILD